MKRLKRLSIGLLTGTLLTACSLNNEPPVTFVVITDTPSVTLTPSATFTASPSPEPSATATPDLPPDSALRLGDRALLDGYYEEAIDLYRLVLVRSESNDDQKGAAAFHGGRAALRAGLFTEAVDLLTQAISIDPNDTRASQAYFLRGDAHLGLSNWQAAIDDFRRYLQDRAGVLDSYAYERIADAQIALGQTDEALVSYRQASDAPRIPESSFVLREKVAQVYITLGNVGLAVTQLDAIAQAAEDVEYRATIEYRAAQALITAGDLEHGLDRMETIVENYPSLPQGLDALNILEANERNINNYQRGLAYYLHGYYQEAIQSFNEYSTETLLADIPVNMYLLLGRAYREVGNADAALVTFQTVTSQFATSAQFGEALLEQGRTRFLSGDITGAINFYLNIVQTYPNLNEAPEAMWRAAYLYGTNGSLAESRRVFEELADKYPQSEQAETGLTIAAEAAEQGGDKNGAEFLYGRLATIAVADERAAAYFQVARLARERGDNEAVEAALRSAITAAPDTYYSARANDILNGVAPFTPPDELNFQFDDLAQLTEAEDWLRQEFSIPAEIPAPLWPLSPELQNDPRIIRGQELWLMGMFEDAETEFFDILDEYENDGLASYRLALFLRGIGAYYPSVVGAANVIRAANVSTLEAPRYIARMRYPTYYRDVVVSTAEERDIDPLLMYSLIRHESLFNTNATAAAGEKGLTQVIPGTGDYIAQQLEWEDYQHADLFRPYAGIAFGAYYLDEQLERFADAGNLQVMAALSGYNAGPGRAITWLENANSDPETFMESITIDSTRLYIQLIYSHHAIYRAIYGTQ